MQGNNFININENKFSVPQSQNNDFSYLLPKQNYFITNPKIQAELQEHIVNEIKVNKKQKEYEPIRENHEKSEEEKRFKDNNYKKIQTNDAEKKKTYIPYSIIIRLESSYPDISINKFGEK